MQHLGNIGSCWAALIRSVFRWIRNTLSLSSSSRAAAAAATHILEVLDEDAGLQLEHIEQLHNRLTEVINLLLGQALTISQKHDLQLIQVLLNIVHIIWNVQPALH